ncbi:unnamed protein product, partial [Ectocarpus sp. 12 AP-2014]
QETYLSHNKPRSAPAAPCEKAARLTKRNGSRWRLFPTHVGPPSHYSDWRVNTKKSTKQRREKLAPEKSRDETHPITTPTSCVFCFLAIPSAYADCTTHYPLVAPFAWCSAGVRSRKRTANPGRSSKIGVMASAQHSSSTSNNNNNRHNEHLDDKPIPSSLPNLESSCHAPPAIRCTSRLHHVTHDATRAWQASRERHTDTTAEQHKSVIDLSKDTANKEQYDIPSNLPEGVV